MMINGTFWMMVLQHVLMVILETRSFHINKKFFQLKWK